MMTIFAANCTGKKTNTSYPFPVEIASTDDLKKVAAFDHVCARYADGKNTRGKLIKAYRSKKTFISSDCLPMDCDNTNPNPMEPDIPEEDWKTPEDVKEAFPDVPFYVVYSRNHMKEKDGKAPRPKFHVYFPMEEVKSLKDYVRLKEAVQKLFPAFDDNAIDGARFFFGVEDPKVEYYAGNTLISGFVCHADIPESIPVGTRNSTLLSIAAKALKRHGDCDKAYDMFREASERCDAPLEREELDQVWANAQHFFHEEIEKDPAYLSPDEFGGGDSDGMVTSDDVRNALQKLGITVRLNIITGQVEITGMPKKYSRYNAPNTLPTLLQDYFSRRGIRASRQVIDDSLVLIEDENRFNPVEEMLQTTTWDGRDRIRVLCSIIGMDVTLNKEISGHYAWEGCTEAIYLIKWLHQCIAMALNDDVEPYGADGVLVIQAPQGKGKTFFFRTIAMKSDWFAEGVSIDLDKKDSIIQATGKWIAELGELDSTLKREQSALKAFLTSAKDTYRQPYAKVSVNKPRRTSFCATVNPKEFLNDETGSRRYWVFQPGNIDVAKLKKLSSHWLSQLWSQVYTTLYLPDPQGFRLTDEERAQLQKDNEQFEKAMPGEMEILEKLHWEVPPEKWVWKKTTDLIFDLSLKNVSPSQMGKVLTKLMARDPRIQVKSPHNVKHYLVPPLWVRDFNTEAAGFEEDFLK